METTVTGKGYFLWIPARLLEHYPSYVEAALDAKRAGITHIIIKVNNNNQNYVEGYYSRPGTKESIDAFRSVGIDVWGWGWSDGISVASEKQLIVFLIRTYDLKTYVFNAEGTFKGRFSQAEELASHVRQNTNVPLLLSSYRVPEWHQNFPWKQFGKYVDYYMPQVYWMQAHNPIWEVNRTIEAYEKMFRNLLSFPSARDVARHPLILTGAAFSEYGWTSSKQDVYEFLRTTDQKALLGIVEPLANFWELWESLEEDLFGTIAEYNWQAGSDFDPNPPPTEDGIMVKFEGTVVNVSDYLRVRSTPVALDDLSNEVGRLFLGARLYATERVIDSAGNLWLKIGQFMYVAELYKGVRYVNITKTY